MRKDFFQLATGKTIRRVMGDGKWGGWRWVGLHF
jgi:hypothetical protein